MDGLERGTGGQGWFWRLTERGSGREEREKRGGRLLGETDYCRTPSELYFTRKRSGPPELVFPKGPPSMSPVT